MKDQSSSDFASASVEVRPAVPGDCKNLVPLINAAFRVETFMRGPRIDEERLAESMQKGTVLLAEDQKGNALASIYMEIRGTRGYLGMLAVDPACQHAGLGRRMMQEAQEHLREEGCVAADISVLSLRPELVPIYRKMGFIEIGTENLPDPYAVRDGVRCYCILMSKWLEDRKAEEPSY